MALTVSMEISAVSELNQARAFLGDSGRIKRHMADVLDESARLGEMLARENAPVRTRSLASAIRAVPANRNASGGLEAAVGVHRTTRPGMSMGAEGDKTAYPFYVHEGTGLYGRHHSLIRPSRAPAMKWTDKYGPMRRKTTRGQKAQPYIEDAFNELVRAYIPQRLDLMAHRIMGR